MPQPREVIFEFHRIGAYIKVSAVDPVSLTEAIIVGNPAVGEAALRRAALRKLDYILQRDAGKRLAARR